MSDVRVLGAVLAGGASLRFGRDKAQAVWRGATLLDHSLGAIAGQVDELILCGREHTSVAWAPDRPVPALGPLGGVNAALHRAVELGMDWVLTVPCDAPVLPGDLRRLLPADRSGAFVAEMPVVGLWPAVLAHALDRHLRVGGSRSVRAWAEAVGMQPVPLGRTIPNVNVPGDLERLDVRGLAG